ncbi:putative transposase IS66 family protein [Escherichia coli]|nr:putative transposase IS66 family protein [Escherichia coli]
MGNAVPLPGHCLEPVTEAACWAHARRKIHDVHVRTPSALTEEALKRIGELYAIEAEIRGMTAEQRLAERQLKTKPLLKSLESWLREKMKTLSRHSELAKAFAYALNQWPALTYYADDGWAEADNNIAENALRMVSLGRKNSYDLCQILSPKRPTQLRELRYIAD